MTGAKFAFQGEISAVEWTRSKSLPRSTSEIFAYFLRLDETQVGFLMFLAPMKTFFVEFGLFRPFRLAHHEWLTSDEYESAERQMKRIFAPLVPSRTKWPQVGDQSIDRFDIALPVRRLSDVLAYFQSMADQLDDPVAPGQPWSGSEPGTSPDGRWVLALTDWPSVESVAREERIRICQVLINEVSKREKPKGAFPFSMCRAISASLALSPFPPRGQFVSRLADFDELHLRRSQLVEKLRALFLYNAVQASLSSEVDALPCTASWKVDLLAQWRANLSTYCDDMASHYPFLSVPTKELFF